MYSIAVLFFAFLALSPFPPSFAGIVTTPSKLPTTVYDYIIVGGGTAGLVVANRLSENSSVTVLVLEAGLSDQGVVPIQVPFLAPTLGPGTPLDWNTTTGQQGGLNGRSVPFNRGRVLGGSSSVNFMFHQYGPSEDWNRLGTVSGDSGWNWANMRQYVQKHEKLVPPTDNHAGTAAQILANTHGTTGEVSISLPGFNDTIDSMVYQTTRQVAEFPFLPDTSGGDNPFLGVGFIQSSVGGGVRSSSSTSYLANALSRPNLVVLTNATAIKVVQTGQSSGLPSLRGVQFVTSQPPGSTVTGPIFNVTAQKEVILSAGTVGSTQLLWLSGIGPARNLQRINITVIVDNPSVGANLTDHLLIPNVFEINGMNLDGLLRDPTMEAQALAQWTSTKMGPFANPIANTYGFLRLPSNSTILAGIPDPASGPNSPHYEMIFTNAWFNPATILPQTRNFLTIVTVVVSPTSRGFIDIASSNPLEPPAINPQYLATDFDINTAVESVNAAVRFATAKPWTNYTIAPFGQFGVAFANGTSAALADAIRGFGVSAFHPVGTAAISATNAAFGVVSPNLTVKGVADLRVVDASVFFKPYIPSCHTQGPVYLMAERASDLIKASA